MFDKFGEFDSYEEINRAAEAQFNQGDVDAIRMIAEENGLDKEDAEDFIAGDVEELTTPLLAAMGKLTVEAKELKLEGFMSDIKESIFKWCEEDNTLCLAVRKKGKCLAECLGKILKVAFESKIQLSDKVVKAAGLRPPIYLGIPSKADMKKIVIKYYVG